jgi:hypothetical protein
MRFRSDLIEVFNSYRKYGCRTIQNCIQKKPAHGRFSNYPVQVKPPPEPQLLPVGTPALLEVLPSDAKAEIFFFVFRLWQDGQDGLWSASEKRTIFSKSSPQSVQ